MSKVIKKKKNVKKSRGVGNISLKYKLLDKDDESHLLLEGWSFADLAIKAFTSNDDYREIFNTINCDLVGSISISAQNDGFSVKVNFTTSDGSLDKLCKIYKRLNGFGVKDLLLMDDDDAIYKDCSSMGDLPLHLWSLRDKIQEEFTLTLQVPHITYHSQKVSFLLIRKDKGCTVALVKGFSSLLDNFKLPDLVVLHMEHMTSLFQSLLDNGYATPKVNLKDQIKKVQDTIVRSSYISVLGKEDVFDLIEANLNELQKTMKDELTLLRRLIKLKYYNRWTWGLSDCALEYIDTSKEIAQFLTEATK